MKVRDSGMPEAELWNSLFDVEKIVSELHIDRQIHTLVEVGSGYGTFTIPASRKIDGTVFAFDIEQDMVSYLNRQLKALKINNVVTECRDVLENSTGLDVDSVDYVMLFNILHHEEPQAFLKEAYRILKPNGKLGIIHWRSDVSTPRGPDLSIRPRPEDIVKYIDKDRFRIERLPFILKPYHFGLLVSKRVIQE